MLGTTPGTSSLARLLFLVLLLLGTAGMHTLGHPQEAAPAAMSGHQGHQEYREHPSTAPAPVPVDDHGGGSGHSGTDPASMCVAVLLGGLAVGLVALAWRRGRLVRGRHLAVARGLGRRLTAALPPARPPDPTHLSVLRI
ncbi:DUF6153 family protein [Embleya sp. NBC_00896]|uniref:DUF6153 family protein n=1 Tax=Embleya sp. NBC_00896 TaxID=2975961 RepID=UPI00386AC264|nr:DUF6153 family protein [Embleya sp. NBC_00896]